MRMSACLLLFAALLLAFSPQDTQQGGTAVSSVTPFPPDGLDTTAAAPPPVDLTPEKRGDLFMAKKMYREAVDMYQQSLGNPRRAVLLNKIGIAYHHMQDLKAAKKNYELALKADPNYGEARNNLGTVAYARKDYRGAIREYQRALKLSPYSATIYSNLGTAYFARKDYDYAAKSYSYALQLDPEVFESRSNTGTILRETGVEERARYHYYMARIYAQAGNVDRALMNIRKSLEEGFKDKRKYVEEPEFAALQDLPEFKQLMSMEFRVL
jgi:tetratricopeptide (TPR) repeat protein